MRYVLLLIPLFWMLGACQDKTAPQAPDPDAAGQVAHQTISQAEVEKRATLLGEKDQKFAQTDLGKQALLQTIAREKLILADAQATKLDKQPDYQQFLQQERARLEEAYQTFSDELLSRIWYEAQTQMGGPAYVTSEEMEDYFKKYHYEMTIKQIIVDNAQTAEAVLRTLKSAPSQWNTMANQYGITPQELKTLSFMPGEYLPELEVVAANSAIGKVQGFFKTPLGFHIIMKTDEKRLKWEDAQPRIREVLENQKIDALLDKLKTKYEVILYDKNE